MQPVAHLGAASCIHYGNSKMFYQAFSSHRATQYKRFGFVELIIFLQLTGRRERLQVVSLDGLTNNALSVDRDKLLRNALRNTLNKSRFYFDG